MKLSHIPRIKLKSSVFSNESSEEALCTSMYRKLCKTLFLVVRKIRNVYIDMRGSESIEYDVESANHSTRSGTNCYDSCFQ